MAGLDGLSPLMIVVLAPFLAAPLKENLVRDLLALKADPALAVDPTRHAHLQPNPNPNWIQPWPWPQ